MIISANIHPTTIQEAAAILRAGQICAFPTETVYGLGADATNADAVLNVYQAKGRPRFNPLIVHCADVAMARQLVVFSPLAEKVAAAFWPGPMSLVLPMLPDNGIADIVTAGLPTLAIRIPAHPAARELIAAVGKPLAAPSANPSGRLSPTRASEVISGFDGQVPVLDGGPCHAGLESTILAIDGEEVVQLRTGALARDDIAETLGMLVPAIGEGSAITAPGMLLNHYAPKTDIRLDVTSPEAGEAYLAFGGEPVFDGPMRNLSPSGDLREAARNLFTCLHELDASGATGIAVAPVPFQGLGEAINDRLQRAAAPRDPAAKA